MSPSSPLSGVFVATITPFDDRGKLSLPAMEAHLQFLVRAGVHGFVPCGTTGEGSLIDAPERRAVLECTLKIARPKGLKVIAGCGGSSTASVLELIHEAKTLGCDGALVVTPYYVKPGPNGLLAHYQSLADEGGLPIVLYNVPSRTGVNLTPDIVLRLLQHPRIIGIKEASGQYGQWLTLARTMNLAERALLAGDDDALAVICALGGSGMISASANVVPEAFVQIYELAKKGNWAAAFDLQKKLQPVIQSLFLESNPAPVKKALELLGHGRSGLRLPLVPVSASTEAAIGAALNEWRPEA